MQKKFPMGTKMTDQEAEAYVAEAFEMMMNRATNEITNGPFMTALREGTLPEEAIRIFWLNWHGFVAEINNLIQCGYQKYLGFFKRHPDLYAVYADKVADELIHPKAPGHILVVWEQGRIFNLSKEEMIDYEMLPKSRVFIDWFRGLLHEGTILEFWSALLVEEYVGHWARDFREGLANYGYSAEKAPYFNTHEEADLVEHEGVMGHGEFNRRVMQALLQEGHVDMRPGFSIPYCIKVTVDYYAMFMDACYEAAVYQSNAQVS